MKHIQTYYSQAIMVLSSIGFVDALFLTQKHYTRDPLACPIFGGCDDVLNSVYSEVFGIPVSLFGMMFYATMFGLTAFTYLTNNKKGTLLAAQLSFAGALTTLGLVYLMLYVIQAICFYCLVSAIISALMFISSIFYLQTKKYFAFFPIFRYIQSLTVQEMILGITRISLGFIFFWAFLSKSSLYFAGKNASAGFLRNGTSGVFQDFFISLADYPLTDHMYIFGMFAVGFALIFGITKRLATIGGILMMLFIYLASSLPPKNNPFVDEHIIYILLLLILLTTKSYEPFGVYSYWKKLPIVKRYSILK